MAYTSSLGLPQILITFQSQASTAMIRSARGVGTMILNEPGLTDEDGIVYFSVSESGDVPATLSAKNTELIKLALMGTPAKVNVFCIPEKTYTVENEVETTTEIESEVWIHEEGSDDPNAGSYETRTVTVPTTTTVTETVTATITPTVALKEIGDLRFNWICHPTGNAAAQQDLATWVKLQRKNKHKTFKAVVSHVAADDYSVVNFTTEKIRIVNSNYTDALAEVGGDSSLVDSSIPQYITYSATEYTARIMGLLAGLSLDRSGTYYVLSEIVDCARYDDVDSHIDNGEFCLIDLRDGDGVRIARACNSLVTFTANTGTDFRFVKTIESIDMIADDIRDTFNHDYVGKIINNYTNKMLLISAVNVYLNSLKGSVLDNSNDSYVEIDTAANKDFAAVHNIDITNYTEQQLKEIPTSNYVFLKGVLHVANAIEDIIINFTL